MKEPSHQTQEPESSTGRNSRSHSQRQAARLPIPSPTTQQEESEIPVDALNTLLELVGDSLTITRAGTGWPALGLIRTAGGEIPVAVYVSTVSGSGRGRPTERRFQNPASRSERLITEPGEGCALLLGVWLEQGRDRAALVALNAYRRLGRDTRFSLFMPLSLLEEAADRGLAEHRNKSGEHIVAFSPTELPNYVEQLLNTMATSNIAKALPKSKEQPPNEQDNLMEANPVSDSANAASQTITFDFCGLVGVVDEAALLERIRERINESEPDLGALSKEELLQRLAEQENIYWSSPLSTESAMQLAAILDPGVALMFSIWGRLGKPVGTPSQPSTVPRESPRNTSFSPVAHPRVEMSALVLSVVRAFEPSISDDDLDALLDGDQPTTFFYEMIQAHLESSDASLDEDARSSEELDEAAEPEDEDEPETLAPINAAVTSYQVLSIFNLVDSGRLNLEPTWQRLDVWSLKKKRELISSLLLGIPVPSIILHRHGKQISIIDGKQRLTSIVKFMRNEFKLPNFEASPGDSLYECRWAWFNKEGKKSLPDGIRTDLELRLVPVLEFNDVPDKDLRSIFRLYNVSGTRLNPAEIRNAVYQTNLIHRVAYVLAGEASPPPDLGTGDLESQKSFTSDLWATLPSRKRLRCRRLH